MRLKFNPHQSLASFDMCQMTPIAQTGCVMKTEVVVKVQKLGCANSESKCDKIAAFLEKMTDVIVG